MNRKIAILLSIGLILSNSQAISFAEENESDNYISNLSAMIKKYDTGDYFSTMSVTIGEPNLVIDGEEIPIDDNGSVAYIENGRTMMSVRGIAEAVGADVDYDNDSQTVTVENEDTIIAMTIGESEMHVNGQSVVLLTAPEIKEGRTMLPVRDVAEALDCEVEWQQETQTATFTRPYQTKRVIVQSEDVDTSRAIASLSTDGKTILQFDTVEDAKKCAEENQDKGITAEPDYIRTIQTLSWGGDIIGGSSYYSQTKYIVGSATVAVIDTGIDYDHEMFANRIYGGYDLYNNDGYSEDSLGHGTHVASTVIDIAGSNTNIKIMPLKVFGTADSCSSSAVAAAIRYATDNGADVINLSLGGQHKSYEEQSAINYANRKNVAVVAAAGNETLNLEYCDYSPGGLDGVITVSALNKDLSIASFSNYGNGIVEFAAPGVSINGAKNGGGYCYKSGTSMAAPHVAAVYALVKAVHPGISTDKITEALSENATKNGNARYYGAGIINANKAEKYLSDFNVSNIEIRDISQNNATITGVVNYSGIKPEKIGVRIQKADDSEYTEIYSAEYEKIFKCNFQSDTECRLSPGTTYKAWIFVKQGGMDYGTSSQTFTTLADENKNPDNPSEPTETGVVLIPDSFENLYIRMGPSTSYEILGAMNHTEKCTVYTDKTQNGWYYVEYNGIKGYAAGNYIYLPSETKVGTVNIPSYFENLYIRTGPSTDYKILGFMLDGEKCTIFTDKTKNGWYFIEYNGIYGFASGNCID